MTVRDQQRRCTGDPLGRAIRVVDRPNQDWSVVDNDTGANLGSMSSFEVEAAFPVLLHDPAVLRFMDRNPAVRHVLLDAWGYIPGCYPADGFGIDDPEGDRYWRAFECGAAPGGSSTHPMGTR